MEKGQAAGPAGIECHEDSSESSFSLLSSQPKEGIKVSNFSDGSEFGNRRDWEGMGSRAF